MAMNINRNGQWAPTITEKGEFLKAYVLARAATAEFVGGEAEALNANIAWNNVVTLTNTNHGYTP